jgi:hypothetical protein
VKATVREVSEIMGQPTCSVEEAAKVLHIGRTHRADHDEPWRCPAVRAARHPVRPFAHHRTDPMPRNHMSFSSHGHRPRTPPGEAQVPSAGPVCGQI